MNDYELERYRHEERIRHDERKKIIAQGCVHTVGASERIWSRSDLQRWQESRSEYFNRTILEIVTEYAEWRDGENLERLKYEGEVMEAVQRLIERGKATLDDQGYLVAIAAPTVGAALPTEEMCLAGARVWLGGKVHAMDDEWHKRMEQTWIAMNAASPCRPTAFAYFTDTERWLSWNEDDAPKADCDFKVIPLYPHGTAHHSHDTASAGDAPHD